MDDSRLTRWCSHLDDIRTEIVDMEAESPPAQADISMAHRAINVAILSLQDAQKECDVCGGVGKVLRAARLENGFDWLAGDRVTCPACGVA